MHFPKGMCEVRGNLTALWHSLQRAAINSEDVPLVKKHIEEASTHLAIAMDEAQKYIHANEQEFKRQLLINGK